MHIEWTQSPGCAVLLGINHNHPLAQGVIRANSAECAALRAGDTLRGPNWSVQLTSALRMPSPDLLCPLWAGTCPSGPDDLGAHPCERTHPGLSLAWITLSDKGSRGERVDASGPAIRDTLAATLPLSLATGVIIPDEPELLKAALVDFCLLQRFDLVCTTGGTGVGPRDITPEVTTAILDKRLPGFERVMTSTSLAKTPHGMISRAVAGVLGTSLIVNLPGSPKAVRENLSALVPAIQHTVEKLQGDPRDCAQ